MAEFSPSENVFTKDYSLRSLWAAVRGLPAAAMFGVASFASPVPRMPDDWELHSLNYQGKEGIKAAEVYVAPARNVRNGPVSVVGFVPGWKRTPMDKAEAIEDLRNSGHSVVSIALENPGMETGSLSDSLQRINSFIFSEDSPLYHLYPENIPRFAITHSTSGMLFEHGLMDARMSGDLPPLLHAFHTSPFFDTSGSSALFHPTLNKIYTHHARKHQTELAGTPFLDRLYYYMRGLGRLLIEEDPTERPTHGQILEISSFGKSYFARKENEIASGLSNITIPQTYVISTDDRFSCPKTAAHAAKLESAAVTYCEAQHNPLLKPPIRRSIIDQIRDITRSTGLFDLLDEIEQSLGGEPLGDLDDSLQQDGPNRYGL